MTEPLRKSWKSVVPYGPLDIERINRLILLQDQIDHCCDDIIQHPDHEGHKHMLNAKYWIWS